MDPNNKTRKRPAPETAVSTASNGSAQAVDETLGNKVATVAIVGVGVALIEAELIPGMLIGVAAMLAPNLLPRVGNVLKPLMKTTLKAGYAIANRTRETMAEASEQIQDMYAEVKAEAEHSETPAGSHA